MKRQKKDDNGNPILDDNGDEVILDMSAGGFPSLCFVGNRTSVKDVQEYILQLEAKIEKLQSQNL